MITGKLQINTSQFPPLSSSRMYFVWLPRWIDRLDINGPCFPARHFLTLLEPHKDYSKDGFYDVDFADHLRPIIRSKPEGARTMLEHLKMFADSQTNDSAYGKYDFGEMVKLRDEERSQLYNIIKASQAKVIFSEEDEERLLKAWTIFFYTNIEPCSKGKFFAKKLTTMFKQLDDNTRWVWINVFQQIMKEYIVWAEKKVAFLDELPSNYLTLPGIIDVSDIREVIIPNREWVSLLK